jgi:hypothetical protein
MMPFFVLPPPGSNQAEREQFNELSETLKEEFGIKKYERPEEGSLKVELKYAYWPTRVCGKLIWLKHYQVMYEYVTRDRVEYAAGAIFEFRCAAWDKIGERIL